MISVNSSDPGDNDTSKYISETLCKAVTTVTDIITDISLPAPIKKNALKAFSQLCTAAIDIPVAYLEGIAVEKRAETAARVKIISTSAQQISGLVKVDPEYAKVASNKYAKKIIREQVNLDRISEIAAIELSNQDANKTKPDSTEKEISDDWLNAFEEQASQKSSEEMQILFGKILAGEIRNPATFSIKTLKLMGQLDARTAKLFQDFCSLASTYYLKGSILDSRVISLGSNAASNSLASYGLNFSDLNQLHEYGLIISDYNSYMNYMPSIALNNTVGLPFKFHNVEWALLPTKPDYTHQEFRVNGVALSRTGQELHSIVEIVPSATYKTALWDFFKQQGFDVTTVG